MKANDTARRKRVRELLQEGALQSGDDFHEAAFIFQHGDTPDDYLLAHVLAMVAVAKGHRNSRWIAAATLDRYLMMSGQSQVFGTQYMGRAPAEPLRQKVEQPNPSGSPPAKDNATVATPPPTTNSMEFVQDPYNRGLISDALRAQYCVVGIVQQEKNVASLNAGKGLSQRLLPGCSD